MEKQKTVADWLDENELTTSAFAFAVDYSPGAVSKWRQKLSFPGPRALKKIIAVQKRCGWTEFPSRIAA